MPLPEKQDANFVGFYLAREESLKKLPTNPVFQTREPNSFADFGAEFAKVARSPFNATRQRKKGTNSDVDVSGGWNEDLTQNNLQSDFEAFTFANMRRKGFEPALSAVASDDHFGVSSIAGFAVGDLIAGSGFTRGANNGLHRITAVAANKITVTSALIDETTPVGGNAKLEIAGHQFAAGDISIILDGGLAKMSSAAVDMRTFGFIPGEWCGVGGDQAATHFENIAPFYARISEVTEDAIFFDKTTATISNDSGAGKTLQLFFGYLVRNEDNPDNIVRHTHVVERTLGKDANGTQSEFLRGFVYNEMTWTSPLAGKVSIDIGGIGLEKSKRTGAEGPLHKAEGTVLKKALGEEAFNTSRNVYRIRMAIIDPETLNPTPMFARVTEWTARIGNNVSAAKAQGVFGGFDTTVGQFEVSMTATAYFSTVEACEAIEENADTTFDAIYAKDNAAIIMDIPLISPGGGRLTVEQNAAIMLPLTGDGAESPFGHTFLLNWLPYVPDALLPSGA